METIQKVPGSPLMNGVTAGALARASIRGSYGSKSRAHLF